jgi:ATP phosphoribosyltransferase regulatory subunit
VAAAGGAAADLFGALLRASGPVDGAQAALAKLDLSGEAAGERARLGEVVAILKEAMPGLTLTVDPVEHRGFEYQTGLSFTVFARGVRGEMGRGGRYRVARSGEPATGFSLFLDSVLRALPVPGNGRRLYLPHGTTPDQGRTLRGEGWITVAGLTAESDPAAEARRLDCTHILRDGAAVALDGDSSIPT